MIKLLLAEDDADDYEFFVLGCSSLKNKRIEVIWKKNGREALDYLDQAARLPDMVVLDLNMPILNGTATLAEIKTNPRYQELPVFMFTTSSLWIERETCLKLGAAGFFTKQACMNLNAKNIEKVIESVEKIYQGKTG